MVLAESSLDDDVQKGASAIADTVVSGLSEMSGVSHVSFGLLVETLAGAIPATSDARIEPVVDDVLDQLLERGVTFTVPAEEVCAHVRFNHADGNGNASRRESPEAVDHVGNVLRTLFDVTDVTQQSLEAALTAELAPCSNPDIEAVTSEVLDGLQERGIVIKSKPKIIIRNVRRHIEKAVQDPEPDPPESAASPRNGATHAAAPVLDVSEVEQPEPSVPPLPSGELEEKPDFPEVQRLVNAVWRENGQEEEETPEAASSDESSDVADASQEQEENSAEELDIPKLVSDLVARCIDRASDKNILTQQSLSMMCGTTVRSLPTPLSVHEKEWLVQKVLHTAVRSGVIVTFSQDRRFVMHDDAVVCIKTSTTPDELAADPRYILDHERTARTIPAEEMEFPSAQSKNPPANPDTPAVALDMPGILKQLDGKIVSKRTPTIEAVGWVRDIVAPGGNPVPGAPSILNVMRAFVEQLGEEPHSITATQTSVSLAVKKLRTNSSNHPPLQPPPLDPVNSSVTSLDLYGGDGEADFDTALDAFPVINFDDLDIDPEKPTQAKPGSEAKVVMLTARYAAGYPLWHTEDCVDHGSEGTVDDDEDFWKPVAATHNLPRPKSSYSPRPHNASTSADDVAEEPTEPAAEEPTPQSPVEPAAASAPETSAVTPAEPATELTAEEQADALLASAGFDVNGAEVQGVTADTFDIED